MTTDKLFRYSVLFAVMLMLLLMVSGTDISAAMVEDDLSGSQEQTQEQVQVPEANPMQEPEQIEEAQNIERIPPQTDETPQPDEAGEIEESEAPPISQ